MEFLKKNWVKLFIAVVLLVGFIFALIGIFNVLGVTGHEDYKAGLDLLEGDALKEAKAGSNASLFMYLGLTIAFLGMAVVVILKMLGIAEKYLPYVAICVGVIALIMLIVSVTNGLTALKETKEAIKEMKDADAKDELMYKTAVMGYNSQIFGGIFNIIVFGLGPILYGVKKMFCSCCKADAQ